MDKALYLILIICLVGYFMLPKIAGFDPPQLYWQWQADKMRFYFNDFKDAGGLSRYLPVKLNPKDITNLYQNAVLDQLKALDNLKTK